MGLNIPSGVTVRPTYDDESRPTTLQLPPCALHVICMVRMWRSTKERGSPESSDSENDSEGPTQQPTPSKPPKKAAGNAAGKQKKVTGKERQYCTQRCLMGIMDQGEFDGQCPNVLEHARESTHNLDSQDFLWLIQQQLAKDRDADCYPLWIQGARGAMFKVSLASHGYTVAAKATLFAFVTDLKHEEAV